MLLLTGYPCVPIEYIQLSLSEKKHICNGCGSKLMKLDLIPDSLWGLSILELCNIHDYMYSVGFTEQDKLYADKEFLNNMFFHIDLYTKNWILRKLRRWQARKYYYCVRVFGDSSFYAQ